MNPAYDAVVIGAGPAGCAAAYDLAAAGRSVLLVTYRERAEVFVEQFAEKGLSVTLEPVAEG